MSDPHAFVTLWLVNDLSRAKAKIKHDIKQLDTRLAHVVKGEHCDAVVIELCDALRKTYSDYLVLMSSPDDDPILNSTHVICTSWTHCHEIIQRLTQQLVKAMSRIEEQMIVRALHDQYQHLSILLTSPEVKPESVSVKVDALSAVLHAHALEEQFQAIVQLANQTQGNVDQLISEMDQLNHQQRTQLIRLFSEQAFVDLMQALFYYQLHPEKLEPETLCPEKWLSINTRLSLLYAFIELLSSSIINRFEEEEVPDLQACLFHDHELPTGVEFMVDERYRELIHLAVKGLQVQALAENVCLDKVHDLLRSYKFWFNPNQLIDATMLLQQILTQQGVEPFAVQLDGLYSQLTTVECLDLYGYFANKDTRYLMRTLWVVGRTMDVLWLPQLTDLERAVVRRVYDALGCVMQTLRDNLVTRQVKTASYPCHVSTVNFSPGQRNRDAIHHIITLYSDEPLRDNARLDALFKSIES